MKKIYLSLAVMASVMLLVSWSSNPPNGNTGAPGEGICSNCHSLGGGGQDGNIALAGFPTIITPNQSYVLTITNSNPNGMANLAGFQMVVLNSSNMNAGDLSGPSATSTTQTESGREYWEHNPAQSYPGSNMVSWTVTWTAPAGPANETITFYAAGNVANGNGNNSGDLIVNTSGSGTIMAGPPPLEVDIEGTNVLCNGQSNGTATATPLTGVPPYAYSWSNGGSTQMVSNLPAGNYFVTVTDSDVPPATGTASIVISQPPPLIFNSSNITHVSCAGENDGAISVTGGGGSAPYNFNWSTGATGQSISNLAAGSYSVTITDDNGCTEEATYMVTQPNPLQISLGNLEHESCQGAEDGSIMIVLSGGTSPYFSEWSNGFIGTSISDLEPGVYGVTVTDQNGCTAAEAYTIDPGSVVNVDLESIMHVTCNGGMDGAISVSGSGGVFPYSYAWSNGQSGPSINNLGAGNYLVTVTDDNGCSVVSAFVINQPAGMAITVSQTTMISCFGDSTGGAMASVTGGMEPYTAMWSNGDSGLTMSDVPAGNYVITVTDANDCSGTAEVIITQPTVVNAIVNTTPETGVDTDDGTAWANVSGGTPGYTYAWSNGETTDTITNLAPGMYTVTVTDQNGCTDVASGTVAPFGCLLAVGLIGDMTICEGTQVLLEAMVSGETGLITYLWSTGETSSFIIANTEGTYCVTVMDEAGCSADTCFNYIAVDVPVPTCGVMNETAPGANDGAISCDMPAGLVSYLWNTGATTLSLVDLAPGEYCVTVTDTLGCTTTACFNVQASDCQLLITSLVTDLVCNGDSSGAISINVENATPPVTYTWSNGDSTTIVQNLPAGDYSVVVADSAGCVETLNFVVNEPPILSVQLDSLGDVEATEAGFIHITASGGEPPYSYAWEFPEMTGSSTDEDLNDLGMPGYYSVIVTDANGCQTGLDSVFISIEVAVHSPGKPEELRVYPVPAVDMLQISAPVDLIRVNVLAIDGRYVRQVDSPENNRIDVHALEPGWYLLHMFDGRQWYIARFVK